MQRTRTHAGLTGLAAAALLLAAAPATLAAAFTWAGATSGTQSWNVDGNWNPATGFPNATDATVTIQPNASADLTINLNQTIDVKTLTVNDSTSTYYPIDIAGNGGKLRLNGSGAAITVGRGSVVSAPVELLADATLDAGTGGGTISGGISGNFSILKGNTSGALTLGGGTLNTYTGQTKIPNGTVTLGADNSIPDTSVVDMSAGSNTRTLSLNGFSDTIAGLTYSTGNIQATVRNNHATTVSTLTIHVAPSTSYTFAGSGTSGGIKDGSTAALNIVKDGEGTQIISGAKTYTGFTTVKAGTLDLGATYNSLASTQINLEGGTLDVDGAAYTMAGTQTYKWTINPAGSGSTGLLKAGSLNISAGIVDFATLGTLDDAAYVLAEYTGLTGSAFATVNNLPSGYTIDYAYASGTKIALVAAGGPPVANDDTAITDEDTAVVINVLTNDTDPDLDPLTVTWVESPATNAAGASMGTVVTNVGATNVTFTPAANSNGTAYFEYRITDGTSTATGRVTVTINAVNDAPTAADDSDSTLMDTPLVVNVLANDTDADGDSLTVSWVESPATNAAGASVGTVAINGPANTNVTFTPSAGWTGTAFFDYHVSDGALTDTGRVTVIVSAGFNPPVAADDTAETDEDVAVVINVLTNDTDPNLDPLTVSWVESPATNAAGANVGTVAINGPANTNVTFTPNADWNGTAYFAYEVSDSGGLKDTGQVTVTVNAVDDPPVATDDTAATDEDVAVVVNVLTNDTDVDSASLTVSWVEATATNAAGGSMGTVAINGPANTNVTFTPAADTNGTAYFLYTVSDGTSTDTGRVTVTIAPVRDPWEPYNWIGATSGTDDWNDNGNWDAGVYPDATDAVVRIARDITGSDLTVELNTEISLNNLYLADTNLPLQRIYIAPGAGGSLRVHGANALFDTVSGNFRATVSAPITLETDLTVDGKYEFTAPIGDDGNARSIIKTDAGDITLAATNTYGGETLLRQGVAALGANNAIPDTSVVNLSNTTTTVALSLSGFSDTIAGLRSTGNQKHKVQNGSAANASTLTIAVPAGQTYAYTVSQSDAGILNGGAAVLNLVKDGEGTQILSGAKSYTGYTAVKAGTLDLGATSNHLTSTLIVLEGGTLDVDGAAYVMPAGQTNRWVLGSGTGLLKAGSLDITAGVADFSGAAGAPVYILAEYTTLTGSGFAATSNVPVGYALDYNYQSANRIALVNPGSPPQATNDTAETDEDTAAIVNVLTNDWDPDGNPLTVTWVQSPATNAAGVALGTVVTNVGATNVTFTPLADSNGVAFFAYRVSDGLNTATAQVTVTIHAVNDPPAAADDSGATLYETATSINVLTNDTDVDSDPLTISWYETPATNAAGNPAGTVVTNAGATNLTFTPGSGFTGMAYFAYAAFDGLLASTARVSVFVSSPTTPPVATNDTAVTDEDAPVVVNVLTNDADDDPSSLFVAWVESPATNASGASMGSVAINGPANTNVTFTPAANTNGTAYFAYYVSDGVYTATGLVTVTINPVDDPPVAADDTAATDEDVAVVINVLTNDTEVDGASLTVTWVESPATNASGGSMGTVAINGPADTNVTFTPAADTNGTAYFLYTVSDGALFSTARVTVTIASVPDPGEAYNWIGPTSGTQNWNQNTNWDVGVFPDATDAVVRIARDITGSGLTVELNTEISLNNLYLADTNGTQRIYIAPGAGGSLRVHGTNALFDTVSGNFRATVSAPITLETDLTVDGKYEFTAPIGDDGNARSLVKTDAGDITLSATNTYGGETLLRQGVAALGANNAIPDTSVVNLSNTTTTATLSLSGFSDTIAGLRSTGNQKHKVQNGSAANPSTLTIAVPAGQTYAYTVSQSDAGILNGGAAVLNVVKDGEGTQILSGAKSYTGYTAVKAGTLDLGATSNHLASALIVLEGGTLDVDGAAYVMPAGQTNRWVLNPAGPSTGLLKAGTLNIAGGVVDFATVGPLGDETFVLAEYTNLIGEAFAAVHNLPATLIIHYTYQGNKIALRPIRTVFIVR